MCNWTLAIIIGTLLSAKPSILKQMIQSNFIPRNHFPRKRHLKEKENSFEEILIVITTLQQVNAINWSTKAK